MSSHESDGEPPSKVKLPPGKRSTAYDDEEEGGGEDDEENEKEEEEGAGREEDPMKDEGSVDDDDDNEDTSVVSIVFLYILFFWVNFDVSYIRCACGNNVDFGLMIQCETCDVWQHAGCVGIKNANAIPSHYYCEKCKPRTFNCSCNKV